MHAFSHALSSSIRLPVAFFSEGTAADKRPVSNRLPPARPDEGSVFSSSVGAMPPPSSAVVFKKTEPGERFQAPTDDELKGAFDTLTRKYGSWVLTAGFRGLGYYHWSCLYKAGPFLAGRALRVWRGVRCATLEKAWGGGGGKKAGDMAWDHVKANSWYSQWTEEQWEEWRQDWYQQEWTDEQWRDWYLKKQNACSDDEAERPPPDPLARSRSRSRERGLRDIGGGVWSSSSNDRS